MDIFNKYQNIQWRKIVAQSALVFVTVLVIVWFMPRHQQTFFRYDIGKPWMYSSLIANFDFPIYKSDESIKAEQDSILTAFQPYYNYNKAQEQQQIKLFRQAFSQPSNILPASVVHVITDRLHRLYSAGIIGTPEYNRIAEDSMRMVRLISGKEARSVQVNCLYSTLTAYETLLGDPTLSPYRNILQRHNLINYIAPNVVYDRQRSEAEKSDLLSSIPLASGMVMSGQKIIDRGDIVDEYTFRVLNSFDKELQRLSASKTEITDTLIGQVLYITLLVAIFTSYLNLFRKDYLLKSRNIAMLYASITVFPIAVSLMITHNIFNVHILPFAVVAIFARVFMDSRTAFLTHVVMVLACAVAVRYQYEFIVIQLLSGLIAIYSLRELSSRSQLFKTALWVTSGNIMIFFAIQLMQSNDIMKMDFDMYTIFIANGVLLLLAYPLMYLIEKTFGFVSNVTLIELSNTNKGVLRDLSEIAPGTFQHSITVGNIAAEIANRIGANSLLVRTGALFHDIGKMKNPVFFTENQAGINPHDNMSYEQSAQIIISHVTDGVKLAEENNLPAIIKEFILTHHGRGVAKYFYIKYKNEHPDEDVDIEKFTYPGPNPFTREQAILMMSDATEAASRSLNDYTEESISGLVNKIIDGQVAEGFFAECPITFRDISLAKKIIVFRLMAIYHTRIQYPELSKRAQDEEKKKEAPLSPAETKAVEGA